MGSASSKASRAAGGAVKRQYPTRIPSNAPSNPPPPQPSQGPTVHPPPQASEARSSPIDRDARDPDFDASLRTIGPVQPTSTFSPSSTAFQNPRDSIQVPSLGRGDRRQAVFPNPASNPALKVLEARNRIAAEAEEEGLSVGRAGAPGRRYLDVMLIRQILIMRDVQGVKAAEIEKRLELADGVVAKLGRKGVFGQVVAS